jgi:hydroxyacylglutathione hydrolase
VVPPELPLLLVAADEEDVEPASRALVRVGLDRIDGFLAGGMQRWLERGFPLATLPQLAVGELAASLERGAGPAVLDVRAEGEWRGGHVEGARNLMGGTVAARMEKVPPGPLAVLCGGGYRSTVVASLLQRAGRRDLWNVTGGMGAWKRAGLPVRKG